MADVDYASNAKANTGVTLGSIGLGLGVLNAMNNSGCCNNGGLLGNVLGGNNCCNRGNMTAAELQYVSQLQAENAQLKSEKYSDNSDKELYAQTLRDNRAAEDRVMAFIKPITDELVNTKVQLATLQAEQKCCCEKQELQAQITAGKINETALALNGKIDTMAATNNGAFNSLTQTINCISSSVSALTNRVDAITSEIVPLCKVCPQPMQRFNTWATPTAQSPDCGSCCAAQGASAAA